MQDPREQARAHFTARRGFVAAAGFGMVGVYLLWAAYGAAPLSFGAHEAVAAGAHEETGGHGQAGGHGGGHGAAANAMRREEFRRLAESFVESNKRADGSVSPPPPSTDVYLMAYQFGFAPGVLRLEAGVPYRFRMMAVDIAHGASVQLAPGARVVRLRPGTLVEQELTFQRPGEYLLYCTVYCGLAHDRMQGRIIVTAAGAPS